MIFDLINRQKLRRCLIYAVYMILTLLAQNVLFSRISILGVKAMFVPAAVVAVGMFEGGVWGAVFGLFTGLFCDMGYGNTALFLWLFPAIGFFAGIVARYYVNKSFFSFLCVSGMAFLFTAFFQSFGLLVFKGQFSMRLVLTGLVQVLFSLPLAAPFYFICRKVAPSPGRDTD